MGPIKSTMVAMMNRVGRQFGMAIVPLWKWRQLQSLPKETFQFEGWEFPYFLHHYNCGRYPESATERTVELALADWWLTQVLSENLVEVGAVTPYYWPNRVKNVVDPIDPHPQVCDRSSILDLDMRGKSVLCISTLEHVGSGEYGLPPDPSALRTAVKKLFAEATAFLVTMPTGYSSRADEVIFKSPLPSDVIARCLVRPPGSAYWKQAADPDIARFPYGRLSGSGCNLGASAVVVWERGGLLRRSAGQSNNGKNIHSF
jgi:hypothetical protein